MANSGAAVASAMVAGDLDIGETDVITLAVAHDRGLPFVYIAPGELHSNAHPTLALVMRDGDVKLGKDFNGKTMACNVSRGFGSLITNVWIDNNGGDSRTVKWVELPFPALSAALRRGTIDGYCAPDPFVDIGVAAGGHLVLLETKPVAPAVILGGWFTTSVWVAKNPPPRAASARRFARRMSGPMPTRSAPPRSSRSTVRSGRHHRRDEAAGPVSNAIRYEHDAAADRCGRKIRLHLLKLPRQRLARQGVTFVKRHRDLQLLTATSGI